MQLLQVGKSVTISTSEKLSLYYRNMLGEFFKTNYSFTNVYKGRMYSYVFFFLNTCCNESETPKFKDEVWPDTSVHIVEEWSVERA